MKVKRKNALRLPKVLGDKGNIISHFKYSLKASDSESSMDDSEIKVDMEQENVPPISSRLRSRSILKSPSALIDYTDSPMSSIPTPSKKRKSSISQKRVSSTKKANNSFKAVKTPTKKKVNRIKSLLSDIDTPHCKTGRYLLRSHSLIKNESNPCPIIENEVFRTPKTPATPLSELRKKPSPVMYRNIPEDLNISQITDCSIISNTLLSRFVKNKSKLKQAENGRNWKNRRKMELSQDSLDTCSCNSMDDIISVSSQTDSTRKILDLCNQSDIKSWNNFLDDSSNKTIKKIGEGVYGEVFRLWKGNVLKVFPVNGDMLANGEDQMTMEDVYSELFVSKKLTQLNGQNKLYRASNFVQLKRATLIEGKLPNILIHHWNNFKFDKGTDNELLDFLPAAQNWVALEYEFAGIPLPEYKFTSRVEVRCIIEQISLSLAVAESAMMFEHRDLHWLNILVKQSKETKIKYLIHGTEYDVMCCGIFVTIIDFTVSRMCVDNNTVYMDMADCPEIFEGEGDYQFDIYRMMKEDNGNNWKEFHPKTNLYWIHYLIDKLLYETSYPRGDPVARTVEYDLKQLYRRVLNYNSAKELVECDQYFYNCRSNSVKMNGRNINED